MHGFLTLSESAQVFYKCDNYYNREQECGIYFDDDCLGIDWMEQKNMIIISIKDEKLPNFNHLYEGQ